MLASLIAFFDKIIKRFYLGIILKLRPLIKCHVLKPEKLGIGIGSANLEES